MKYTVELIEKAADKAAGKLAGLEVRNGQAMIELLFAAFLNKVTQEDLCDALWESKLQRGMFDQVSYSAALGEHRKAFKAIREIEGSAPLFMQFMQFMHQGLETGVRVGVEVPGLLATDADAKRASSESFVRRVEVARKVAARLRAEGLLPEFEPERESVLLGVLIDVQKA